MNTDPLTKENALSFTQNWSAEDAAILENYAVENGWTYIIEPAEVPLIGCENEVTFTIFYNDPEFGNGLDNRLYRIIDNAYNPPKKLAKAIHVGNDFYILEDLTGLYAVLNYFLSDTERSEGLEKPEDGEINIEAFPAMIHVYVDENSTVVVKDVPLERIFNYNEI